MWDLGTVSITDCVLGGIKAVRECAHIRLERCQVESQEFGWKSQDITLVDTDIVSEYLFMDSREVRLRSVKIKGKYSYVTVKDSIVKGEYLDGVLGGMQKGDT